MRRLLSVPPLFALLFLVLLAGLPQRGADAAARSAGGRTVGTQTGLPIPRYVTVRSEEVNLRTGPGIRYPIDWVVRRRGLPVEIVAEFDNWRRIRDSEGTEGWVHQSMLSGRRSVLVIGEIRTLRRSPDDTAPAVARIEPGVIAWLEDCRPNWCEIEVAGLSGWINRAHLWGIRVDEGRE